jgi:hypothetical protein
MSAELHNPPSARRVEAVLLSFLFAAAPGGLSKQTEALKDMQKKG